MKRLIALELSQWHIAARPIRNADCHCESRGKICKQLGINSTVNQISVEKINPVDKHKKFEKINREECW